MQPVIDRDADHRAARGKGTIADEHRPVTGRGLKLGRKRAAMDEDDGWSRKALAPQWRIYVDDALTATPSLGNGKHKGLQERRIGHIRIESDIPPCGEPGEESGADLPAAEPLPVCRGGDRLPLGVAT